MGANKHMKKWCMAGALLIGSVFMGVTASANDPWFDIGKAIGSSIGNPNTLGNSDKNFYCDPTYDFSQVRYVVVGSTINPQAGGWISDPYIAQKYPEVVWKALNEKKIPVFTFGVALKNYIDHDASKHPEYTNEQHVAAALGKIYSTGGVFVNAQIMAYSQDPYYSGIGNCFINFTVYGPNGQTIMYYSDKRLNAPRSSKEGMSERIAGAFAKKFNEVYKKARGEK